MGGSSRVHPDPSTGVEADGADRSASPAVLTANGEPAVLSLKAADDGHDSAPAVLTLKEANGAPAVLTLRAVDYESAAMALSGAQLKRIQSLFDKLDIDSAGKLPLSAFNSSTTSIGPYQDNIFKKLNDMDCDMWAFELSTFQPSPALTMTCCARPDTARAVDSDGFVTRQEWETYFTAMASLSEEEFGVIVEELSDTADIVVNIIVCTRIAAEAPPLPPQEDMDAPIALTPPTVSPRWTLSSAPGTWVAPAS
eukprot:6803150-Prymnesium_polylepis.1